MKKAKIYYFSLTDEMRKEEKLEWFCSHSIAQLEFEYIQPDKNSNWINLADNDWEKLLPTISYDVKNAAIDNTIFKTFSNGIATNRDYWVYDESLINLEKKIKYFIERFNFLIDEFKKGNLPDNTYPDDIKWSYMLKNKFNNFKYLYYNSSKLTRIYYRPFKRIYYYCDFDLSDAITLTHFEISGKNLKERNKLIWFKCGITSYFFSLCVDKVHDIMPNGGSKCLPLYRYDKDGSRIDNITDWALEQFRNHYQQSEPELTEKYGKKWKKSANSVKKKNPEPKISKEDIFHYIYAVLLNPAYRQKYELNLKREFPRIPFYSDFRKWADWGKILMDLHISYESAKPFDLKEHHAQTKAKSPRSNAEHGNEMEAAKEPETMFAVQPKIKPRLKADKEKGMIELDETTSLSGVPKQAWEYRLGNRSALEWILDQYKEKKPKDPTIAEKFNTYRFADYKDHVIDLLKKVCTVSVETMKITDEMKKETQAGLTKCNPAF